VVHAGAPDGARKGASVSRRFDVAPAARPVVSEDLPADVRETLGQLFDEAGAAARDRRPETTVAALDSAATVVENKLPEGDLKRVLAHGCERASATVEGEPLVAAEYCAAMRDRL
jgi:hypothetical protein